MQKPNSGFTLLETMVAVAVLAMVIIGPLELATRSIGYAKISQNQIIASYLAQEAIEFITNKRDSNMKTPGGKILDGLKPTCTSQNCYIDIFSGNITACRGICPYIRYGNVAGYDGYNYSSGEETIFIRVIRITELQTSIEARVEVSVNWEDRSGEKSFTLEKSIFKW